MSISAQDFLANRLKKRKGIPAATASIATERMFTLKPRIATSQPVTVVPIFAPMMTPAAWTKVRSPALTKLTTMTVVAEEDWIRVVMLNPVSTELNLFPVMKLRIFWRRSPAVR